MSAAVTQVATKRPEDEFLGIGKSLGFGAQHVLTMYGGIIAPPLIVGAAAGVPAPQLGLLVACCLFIGGLATILQSVGIPWFGSQLPLVQGTSFASVATLVAIATQGGGMAAVFGSVMGGNPKLESYGSVANITLAGFTLLVVLVLSRANVQAISRLSILLAIVIGTVAATVVGMANWSNVGN